MSDLDRYDVEAMIRDALHDYARKSDLDYLDRELRAEIGYERKSREDSEQSLWRVLNSRTEHLA